MVTSKVARLSDSWERRAQVRNLTLEALPAMDRGRPDFDPTLLAFGQGLWSLDSVSDAQRELTLSIAALIFNEAAIDLEHYVILPASIALYEDRLAGVADHNAKRLITETMTDETYHSFITENASAEIRVARGLEGVRIGRSHVVRAMHERMAQATAPWQRDVTLVATAIVTEVFISSILRSIVSDDVVQPLLVETTRRHLLDEQAHRAVFREIAERVYPAFDGAAAAYFIDSVWAASSWFDDPDLGLYAQTLRDATLPIDMAPVAALVDAAAAARVTGDAPVDVELLQLVGDLNQMRSGAPVVAVA